MDVKFAFVLVLAYTIPSFLGEESTIALGTVKKDVNLDRTLPDTKTALPDTKTAGGKITLLIIFYCSLRTRM